MSFSSLLAEFRTRLESRKEVLRKIAASDPRRAYTELNQIAQYVSARYGVSLQLNFPDPKKIKEIDCYGKENIAVVVDPGRKRFPVPRDAIKEKARRILGDVETRDAYMYEGKEGLKIFFKDGSRMDILPGSIHVWCRIDDSVTRFIDWLMLECYQIGTG